MVEGRMLGAFRDIVVIVGMIVLCFVGLQGFASRTRARREQEARFAIARSAIAKLDDVYQKAMVNKSVNEQFFRQNELLLEYQKLMLTLAYMPVVAAPPANGAKQPTRPPAR